MMKIIIAEHRGFCPGVKSAIELAEKSLKEHSVIYSLGEIIHNHYVVNKLKEKGLIIVDSIDQIPEGNFLLIRSHGVSPDIIEQAKARKIKIIDATCILVKRAQNIARNLSEENYQVIMIGNPEHPEVRGIIGYAKNVIVIRDEKEIAKLRDIKRMGLVSQTTLDQKKFAQIVAKIIEQGFEEIKIVNTLCGQAVRRQNSAYKLAQKVDVVFVLGGKHSSNTTELANITRRCGVRTYHLEGFWEFSPEMIKGANIIGITAGASTPEEIVQEFVKGLSKYDDQ